MGARTELSREEHATAVSRGVEWALLDVLGSSGDFPLTRDRIIEAIRGGVRDAFIEVFGQRPDDPDD
jgi:hypothetical protein